MWLVHQSKSVTKFTRDSLMNKQGSYNGPVCLREDSDVQIVTHTPKREGRHLSPRVHHLNAERIPG